MEKLNAEIVKLQTANHAHETERRHQSEIMQAVLKAMQDPVLFVDKDFKIIWANDAAARKVSSIPEGVVGQKCYNLKGFDQMCEGCPAKLAMMNRVPQNIELGFGDYTYILSSAPVDVNGYHGAICISRDITHRERNAELVRRAYLRAEAFCRVGTEGIVIHRGGKVIAVNKNFVDMIGYTEEDFHTDPELGWKIIAPEFRDKVKKMIEDSVFEPYTVKYITKHHGEVSMSVKPNTLDYGNGVGACRVAIITPQEDHNG